ncbi:LamG-like jellyroll fold domain-containing protein [Nonomuraea sp. NPDC001831]|uniref:LamG-like jellyroll fold domain-containing protein n=1 Tax=Nonomuraea sp. NPDC001831 TaxID=3364340 RepID=UPI003675212B
MGLRRWTAVLAAASLAVGGLAGTVWTPPQAVAEAVDAATAWMVKPLFRLRGTTGTDNTLFTSWETEYDSAVTKWGYTPEGQVLHVSREAVTGLSPVTGLRKAGGDRIFTIDQSERDQAVAQGYVDEGVRFHAQAAGGDGLLPVHQLVKGPSHRYAIGEAEKARALAEGWTYQKVAFYGRGSFSKKLLINGEFTTDAASWEAAGPTTTAVENGVLKVTVADGTTEPGQAHLRQLGRTLQAKKTYTLSFDAHASAAATIRAVLCEDVETCPEIFATDVELPDQPQHFSYTFDSTADTTTAALTFQLGGQGALTAFLDNVSLTEQKWTVSTDPKPTEAEALAAAEATGQLVEVLAERGETREVYATPEGTMYVNDRLAPIRKKQGDTWVPLYNGLRFQDGTVRPYSSLVDLRLSAGGTGPMATLTRSGHTMSLTWPTALPTPTLDGDTAVYAGVLGPDVDLRVRATADGFAHTLVVKTPAAAQDPRLASLTLGLSAPTLTVSTGADGTQEAVDPDNGAVIFEAPRPVMWDSAAAPPAAGTGMVGEDGPVDPPTTHATDGAPGDASKIATIGTELGQGQLTLTPDPAMLTAADTTFPVYIDPMYRTPMSSANLMVASSGFEIYNFTKDQGMGRCPIGLPSSGKSCGSPHKKRLFYRIPTGWLAGKQVLSAEFHVREVWAASGSKRPVNIHLAKAFGKHSTWNSTSDNWLRKLDSRNVAKGWSGCAAKSCPAGDVLFNVTSGVKEAAQKGWRDTTFGLRAADEGDQLGWKRFESRAYLRVHYNRPPLQPKMSQLEMEPGGPCKGPGNPSVFNWSTPKLIAKNLRDPDTYNRTADKVQAEFLVSWKNAAGQNKEWRYLTSAKSARSGKAGNSFMAQVPRGLLPENTVVNWQVRAQDSRKGRGPWSSAGAATACYFVFDTKAPPLPVITSSGADGYVAENPLDPAQTPQDGMGRYGRFVITFDPSVTEWAYAVNDDPTQFRKRTAGSATETVQILPRVVGSNSLYVRVKDQAGNYSKGSAVYRFRVAPGRGPKAHWKLNDPAGATTLAETGGRYPARTAGTPQLGVAGSRGTAMAGNGTTAYARTDAAVLDTTKSFTVTAWAKLPDVLPSSYATVLAQDGGNVSGFCLRYDAPNRKWVFWRMNADSTSAASASAWSAKQARPGEWTHLMGVFDSVAKKVRIYVNGEPGTEMDYTSAWAANGPLTIGRVLWGAQPLDHFPGKIDDVRVYDRVVSVEEAAALSKEMLTVTHKWHLNNVPDDSGEAPRTPVKLYGAARFVARTPMSNSVVPGSLRLPGATGDYAAVESAVLDPRESFTLSAWVETSGQARKAMTLLNLPMATGSALTVKFDPARGDPDMGETGRYVVEIPGGAAVEHPAFHTGFGDWDHLAIVYRAREKTLEFWVNGTLEAAPEAEVKSYRNDVALSGPITSAQLGRGGTGLNWSGHVDDVWVLRGPADESLIDLLALWSEMSVVSEDALNDNTPD